MTTILKFNVTEGVVNIDALRIEMMSKFGDRVSKFGNTLSIHLNTAEDYECMINNFYTYLSHGWENVTPFIDEQNESWAGRVVAGVICDRYCLIP